ncbi:MAG: hypothetical protein LJE84_06075 [Gammaproteobacteria bacterium]|nr:hypothetical protein [Gammaproteobacteria bacterium]
MEAHRFCREFLRGTAESVAGRWLRADAARGWNALQALGLELREIPRRCSDPQIARLKLAWWQDQLGQPRPQHPLAQALADCLGAGGGLALAPIGGVFAARLDGTIAPDYFRDSDGLLCRLWQLRHAPAITDPCEFGALLGEARALLELGADLRGVGAVPETRRGPDALARAAELQTRLRFAARQHPGAGPGLLAALLAATLQEIHTGQLDPALVRTRLPAWRMHRIALLRRIGLGRH